jgi:hypothetical protein
MFLMSMITKNSVNCDVRERMCTMVEECDVSDFRGICDVM